MKKVLSWLLVISMMMTAISLPMAVFAEKTTESGSATEEGTTTEGENAEGETTPEETPVSNQVVHFKLDFDDYSISTGSFPASTATGYDVGVWSTLMESAGYAVDGIDGKAFHFTRVKADGAFATYNPTANVTTGKWLWSFDMAYNTSATNSRVTWLMNNASPTYLYFMALQDPTSTSVSSVTAGWSNANGAMRNQGNLFKATDSEKEYTVDMLLDFDNNLATYYVNGVEKTSNKMSGAETYTFDGASFKLNLNNNINKLDNFMLIENPDAQYSFSQKGEVTTESEYITVRFSDTVYLTDTTDFIITDANGETAATVTEIEQVNGKFYNLKLGNKLAAGTYNLALNDTTLTSVIAGTTSSNTTSEFTVIPEYTYFDIDFEEYTTSGEALTYYNTFNQYGSFTLANNNDQTKSNTYGFAGDDSMGITCSNTYTSAGEPTTRNLCYTLSQPITSGKLVISYDAAFDSTRQTSRQQMLYIEDSTNGCILTYGINGNVTVIAGAKASGHYSGGSTKAYVDNQAYRWDTVIDLDAKTITNYCDGVQFNKVTYTSSYLTDGDIKNVYMRFKPAITFFDNYKMTVNVDTFGYSASDIDTYSNKTIVSFDDTMILADTDLVFKDPDGNIVTPASINKITPRKYEVTLPDLYEGTYKVALADGKTSAIGNTANIEYAAFTVAERPAREFYATSLAFSDVDGGVTLTSNLSNIAESAQKAFLIIGVYANNVLEECVAEVFEIQSGEVNTEKSVTLITDKDLSGYTVRGFVWDREDFAPLIGSITK